MNLSLCILLGLSGAYRCMESQFLTAAELGGKPPRTFEIIPEAANELTKESVSTLRKARSNLNPEMANRETLMSQSRKVAAMKTECKSMRRSFAVLEQDVEKLLERFGTTGRPSNILDIWEQLKRVHSYVLGLVQVYLYKHGGLDWKMLQASPKEDMATAQGDFSQCRELPEVLLSNILEDWKADWLQRVVTILHSVASFSFVPEDWDEIRQIKVSFEKCVFQSVQFLYKFKFFKKKDLREFFLSPGTLEVTGDHLFDIFQSRNGGFDGNHAFRPDMDFILSNWQTEHLHEALRVLTKSQRGDVLYEALSQTIRALTSTYKEETSVKAVQIYRSFINEDFLPALKSWKRKHKESHANKTNPDFILKNTIQKIIDYFERPPENTAYRKSVSFHIYKTLFGLPRVRDNRAAWKAEVEAGDRRLSAEYLLNYYLLCWIQTYHCNYDLKNHFRPQQQRMYALFQNQIELLRLGLNIQEHIQNIIDYSYFLNFPEAKIYTIPRQVSIENKTLLQESLKQLTLAYITEKKDLKIQLVDLDSSMYHSLYHWLCKGGIIKHILDIIETSAQKLEKTSVVPQRNSWLMEV